MIPVVICGNVSIYSSGRKLCPLSAAANQAPAQISPSALPGFGSKNLAAAEVRVVRSAKTTALVTGC